MIGTLESLNDTFSTNKALIISFIIIALGKFDLEGSDLRFDTVVVLSSADHEITVHAPLIAVRVSNDPIWHILFFVMTPADNIY